jgi:hypothetical protein
MSKGIKELFLRLLKIYFEDAVCLVKIRAASCYVKAVAAARSIFISHIILKCYLLLMLAGFVLMHVGLFIALPCSTQLKGIILLVLGAVYFIISLVYVLKMCSQKFWMEYSKASELVEKVAGKK